MAAPTKLLALLLRLAPREFRERNGPQILEDAEERLQGRAGPSRLLTTLRIGLDILWVAASVRLAGSRLHDKTDGGTTRPRSRASISSTGRATTRSTGTVSLAVSPVFE